MCNIQDDTTSGTSKLWEDYFAEGTCRKVRGRSKGASFCNFRHFFILLNSEHFLILSFNL